MMKQTMKSDLDDILTTLNNMTNNTQGLKSCMKSWKDRLQNARLKNG
jgi:hypothetical protein